jgi:hypothetical protein
MEGDKIFLGKVDILYHYTSPLLNKKIKNKIKTMKYLLP